MPGVLIRTGDWGASKYREKIKDKERRYLKDGSR